MPPALLAVVKRALHDDAIPTVNGTLPALRESSFFQYPNKPLVFRSVPQSSPATQGGIAAAAATSTSTDPRSEAALIASSPLLSARDQAGPGMVMVSQALLKDNMVQLNPDTVEVLRVRRWVGSVTAHYAVETFDVLLAPPSVLQNQFLLKDARRIAVQGTVFRALRVTPREQLLKQQRMLGLDHTASLRRDLPTLELLFHDTLQPLVSDGPGANAAAAAAAAAAESRTAMTSRASMAHAEQHERCMRSMSVDTFSRSQGETMTSESICSVQQSRSLSHMEETPIRVVAAAAAAAAAAANSVNNVSLMEEEELELMLEEKDKHLLWMKSAIHSLRSPYTKTFDISAGWERWDAKCHDGLNRSLIVNSIDDVILYCGGSRKAAFAAVQFLDRFVALTPNPVETCREMAHRVDSRRATPIFPPIHDQEPKLNLYFISVIGVCCMLGCKMEDKAPPHIERLNKCLLSVELTNEDFVRLEMFIFQKLHHNLAHNSMEQVIEMLLYIFCGDDDALYAIDHNATTDKNPSAWKQFQQLCRFLGDVTLRGLSPAENKKFDAAHQVSSLNMNPFMLGITVVAFAAKIHQVQLPDPLLALLPQQLRETIRDGGVNCLPLLQTDKRYALLLEFCRMATNLLSPGPARSPFSDASTSKSFRSNTSISSNSSNNSGLGMPRASTAEQLQHQQFRMFLRSNNSSSTSGGLESDAAVSPIIRPRQAAAAAAAAAAALHVEETMSVALRYVQAASEAFRSSHEDTKCMRSRYPHLMRKPRTSKAQRATQQSEWKEKERERKRKKKKEEERRRGETNGKRKFSLNLRRHLEWNGIEYPYGAVELSSFLFFDTLHDHSHHSLRLFFLLVHVAAIADFCSQKGRGRNGNKNLTKKKKKERKKKLSSCCGEDKGRRKLLGLTDSMARQLSFSDLFVCLNFILFYYLCVEGRVSPSPFSIEQKKKKGKREERKNGNGGVGGGRALIGTRERPKLIAPIGPIYTLLVVRDLFWKVFLLSLFCCCNTAKRFSPPSIFNSTSFKSKSTRTCVATHK
eukprot:gene3841-2721_t